MTRTAIIGLGIMGRRMLEHMGRHPRFDPCLLWDPDPAARALAAEMAPDATITATASEAIAAADCVYLACPPAPRAAYAREAAALGKPLFLEKPLGVDVAESRALAADLEAAGVPVAINFTQAAGEALAAVTAARDSGALGALAGVDLVVTYPAWPRAWQKDADWLRFRAEGGYTREVISHFVFFTERVIGPTEVIWARPSYPADTTLCETHLLARLENADGVPVSILGSIGGAQPDRQEVTVKGGNESHRISEFSFHAVSRGGAFEQTHGDFEDRRAVALAAQLDGLAAMIDGAPHPLATLREALGVQERIEAMLAGVG
jgi:predicted dehydrogenase